MAKGSPQTDLVTETVPLTHSLYEHLRYLGRVDNTSVPSVIRKMIDNGIRQRKATDAGFREYTRRRS